MDSDNEIEEPPSPTPLEQMQERHQAYLRWCAAMLEASVNAQESVREQLARARERRNEAMTKLLMVKCLRAVTEKITKTHMNQLKEASSTCSQIIRELYEETIWRPASITMSQRHQRELRERVARLKALLEIKKRQSRRGLSMPYL